MLWIGENCSSPQHRCDFCAHIVLHSRPPFDDDIGVIRWTTRETSNDVHRLNTSDPRRDPQVSRLQPLQQIGHLLIDLFSLAHLPLDLLYRMNDRRVIASTKQTSDARVTQIGEFTEDIHRDLT